MSINSGVQKKKPNGKQLRWLRDLALQTNTTFVYPHTFGKASAEIRRLLALREQQQAERDRRDPDDLIGDSYELQHSGHRDQVIDFDHAPDAAYAL